MYRILILCDSTFCRNETTVDTQGAAPMGWVQLRHGDNESSQPVAKTFCCWKCLLAYAKNYVEEEMKEDAR